MTDAHAHDYITEAIRHAPPDEADPIRHTNFLLLHCRTCPAARVFPEVNYYLTTPSFRAAFEARLRVEGLELTLDGPPPEQH